MTTHTTARWRWVIAAAVVVIAAAAVTTALTISDTNAANAAAPAASPRRTGDAYDLSTPQAAAASFYRAATTGSGDALLALSCVSHAPCVAEHAAAATGTQLSEERATIRDGVYELAQHLEDVEFANPVDGPTPDTKNVPYRTPAMAGEAFLTFTRSGDDWLYYRPLTG
jgi:hypothetical protein